MNSSSQVRHSDIVSLHYLLIKVTSERWISVWLVHSHQEKPISENFSLRKHVFRWFVLKRLIGRASARPTLNDIKWRLMSRDSDMVGVQYSLKCKNSMNFVTSYDVQSRVAVANKIHKFTMIAYKKMKLQWTNVQCSLPNELLKKYICFTE